MAFEGFKARFKGRKTGAEVDIQRSGTYEAGGYLDVRGDKPEWVDNSGIAVGSVEVAEPVELFQDKPLEHIWQISNGTNNKDYLAKVINLDKLLSVDAEVSASHIGVLNIGHDKHRRLVVFKEIPKEEENWLPNGVSATVIRSDILVLWSDEKALQLGYSGHGDILHAEYKEKKCRFHVLGERDLFASQDIDESQRQQLQLNPLTPEQQFMFDAIRGKSKMDLRLELADLLPLAQRVRQVSDMEIRHKKQREDTNSDASVGRLFEI
ncbi:MAG: hypothetical protein FWE31_02230 [Firmicutes bacterium]|nr:hypothetical protein [Bacillota bacterium]